MVTPWLQNSGLRLSRHRILNPFVQRQRNLRATGPLLALLVLGCTVGPNYQPPQSPMPVHWHSEVENGLTSRPVEIVRWWELFGDSQLQTLVERAVIANKDLKTAEARVREARAQWRAAGASRLSSSSTRMWPFSPKV